MNDLKKRVQKIEAARAPKIGVTVVIRQDGETDEECLLRHGFDPIEDRDKVVVGTERDVDL